jgi:hypothetical protein
MPSGMVGLRAERRLLASVRTISLEDAAIQVPSELGDEDAASDRQPERFVELRDLGACAAC